jgi:hypothetical protein
MNFRAMSILKDVTVRNDAIGFDEEATAAREFLAARVKSFNGDSRWLNAANEFGKNIL